VRWLDKVRERHEQAKRFYANGDAVPFEAFDPDAPEHVTEFLRLRREWQERQEARWRQWAAIVGERYAGCTFESFEATTKAMTAAVQACRQYAEALAEDETKANLVLYGNCGGGKDHLAVAVCRVLYDRKWEPVTATDRIYRGEATHEMVFTTGAIIMTRCRDAIGSHREDITIAQYAQPSLLVLSDPTPPSGDQLTGFQASALVQVIDRRYRAERPTIVTINCRDRDQMNAMLTTPVADRLCHGAVAVPCDWPSYRRARG